MTKFIYRARSYFVLMIYSYRINLRHTLHIILHKKYFATKAKLRRKKLKNNTQKQQHISLILWVILLMVEMSGELNSVLNWIMVLSLFSVFLTFFTYFFFFFSVVFIIVNKNFKFR